MTAATIDRKAVEARIRERMDAERAELNDHIAEAEKRRTDHCKQWDDAFGEFTKLSDAAIKCGDEAVDVPAKLEEDLNAAHRKTLAAMNGVIGVNRELTRMRVKLAELDEPNEFERRVEQALRFEDLRQRGGGGDGEKAPRSTGLSAAIAILRSAEGPMHYREITQRALESGLIRTHGKTPEATMNSMLATRAKAGDTFVKTGPGTFDLLDRTAEPKAEAEPKPKAEPKAEPKPKAEAKKGAAKKGQKKATAKATT